MAGNSVPIFFGAKARTKKPPGIDVTTVTDISGSMQSYIDFITSVSTISALENALLAQGIGVLSSNRYSFMIGATNSNSTLAGIERFGTVNGVSQRWVPGQNVLSGTAVLPTIGPASGGNGEDMGQSWNLITGTSRSYLTGNERIIIAGSNEQSYNTPYVVGPPYPHRYVGIHSVLFSIVEPAGPNPVPAGVLSGFVYTTSAAGTAIYINGSTINYRSEVPVAKITATATVPSSGSTTPTLQVNIDQAKITNGAIYSIDISFPLLGTSLGTVLGQYLFETS